MSVPSVQRGECLALDVQLVPEHHRLLRAEPSPLHGLELRGVLAGARVVWQRRQARLAHEVVVQSLAALEGWEQPHVHEAHREEEALCHEMELGRRGGSGGGGGGGGGWRGGGGRGGGRRAGGGGGAVGGSHEREANGLS
jgi:uncharacterized membrane protein YgcG